MRTPTVEDRMRMLDVRVNRVHVPIEGPGTIVPQFLELTVHYRKTNRCLLRIQVPTMPENTLHIVKNRYRREIAELWTANP